MAKVGIAELKAMDDAKLLEVLGFQQQVDQFKAQIAEADSLKGDAREKVEEEIQRMFTPHVYPGDLKYSIERAKRKNRTGKEEAACCSCDILD